MWKLRCALFSPVLACALGVLPALGAEISDGRLAMGTVLEIALVAGQSVDERSELERAFATVSELESRLSSYVPGSDISRLNRRAGNGSIALHPQTLDLLIRSVDAARQTDGAFDICVGPLVSLWTRAAGRGQAPTEQELAEARDRTDARRIRFDSDGRVGLPDPGMAVDLGGIAKGYALDRVVAGLRKAGVDAALLSFGESSVWALGAPPGDEGWRLLVRTPGGGIAGRILLRDRALSVSSSFGQSREIAGQRYGHVIDPRSGRALSREVTAIVLASDATLAEALSTALVVLGPERGIDLAGSIPGVEARVTDRSGTEFETSGWSEETGFSTLPQAAPRRTDYFWKRWFAGGR